MKKTYFLDNVVRIGKRFRNGWNDMISSEKMKKMSEVTHGNIENGKKQNKVKEERKQTSIVRQAMCI